MPVAEKASMLKKHKMEGSTRRPPPSAPGALPCKILEVSATVDGPLPLEDLRELGLACGVTSDELDLLDFPPGPHSAGSLSAI